MFQYLLLEMKINPKMNEFAQHFAHQSHIELSVELHDLGQMVDYFEFYNFQNVMGGCNRGIGSYQNEYGNTSLRRTNSRIFPIIAQLSTKRQKIQKEIQEKDKLRNALKGVASSQKDKWEKECVSKQFCCSNVKFIAVIFCCLLMCFS